VSETAREIDSQPDCWVKATEIGRTVERILPAAGERVAVVGCGTSLHIGRSYAALREALGAGETDAFPASEFPVGRRYDRIVAISRSGTTTEVVQLLERMDGRARVLAIGAAEDSPVFQAADDRLVLGFADERSVVQTRFPTTVLAALRAGLGEDLDAVIDQARTAARSSLPVDAGDFDHAVFLGRGWTVGLADEAALKLREAAQVHAESYPSMEYRHGPISLAGPRSLVWLLGPASGDGVGPRAEAEDDIAEDVRATGAFVRRAASDPMAELILIQRTAVAVAGARGLDPDHPRHLTRSVVLS
jgi:fructoselysine-6-P-deglycase FrlB-like protein